MSFSLLKSSTLTRTVAVAVPVPVPVITTGRASHWKPTTDTKRYLSSTVFNRFISNTTNNHSKRNTQQIPLLLKKSSIQSPPLLYSSKRYQSTPTSAAPSATPPSPYIQYQSVVITLAGPDRAGIVHELSEQLETLHGNIEESRMTILGNDFAVILLASIPQDVKVEELRDKLSAAFPGFIVSSRPTAPPNAVPSTQQPPVRIMRLAVEGPDQPGVVRALTELLYKYGVSIRDLDTDTSSAPFAGYKVFSLKGIIAIPTKADFNALDDAITAFEEQYGFDVELIDANDEVDEDEDADMEDEADEGNADDTVPNVLTYDRRGRQAGAATTIEHHPHTHYAHHPSHATGHRPSSSTGHSIQERIAAAEAARRRGGR